MNTYQRITQTSIWLSRLCLILILVLPFYLAHHWLLPREYWITGMPFPIYGFDGSWPPPLLKQFLGVIICLLPGLLAMKALWHLRSLFSLYAQGIIFTARNVALCSKTASAVLGFVIVWIITGSLLSVAMSYDSENRYLAISFTQSHLATLLAAIFLRLITWVMAAGQELSSENQSFI